MNHAPTTAAAPEAQGERLRLVAAADVPVGAVHRYAAPGRRALAVYNVDGEFFVTDDRCTHGMGSLSEGFLDGDVIECPWHGGAFNVRTGLPASMPCTEAIRIYRAVVEDGFVVVDYR